MDENVKNYLMQKYGQSFINPQPATPFMLDPANQIPDPAQPPQPPQPFMLDPANHVPDAPVDDGSFQPIVDRSAASPQPAPKNPPADDSQSDSDNHDIGMLSDEELKRYGIRSPEEIAALRKQRIKMGNDFEKQGNMNVLAKSLAMANDQVNNTGNRILAGNTSNTAPGVASALDESLKGKQAKIQAFDDANEKVGESDYKRLADVDDKRLKIQQLRDASKDRSEDRKVTREQTAAYREAAMGARNDRFNTEQDRKLDERVSKFGKALSSLQSGARNAIGRSANTYLDSQAVLALAGTDEKQWNKLTPQQVYEVARAYDRVVSRGSPTASATAHLIPKSALMSAANFNQWLSSSPAGANVAGLVKTMIDGSKREGAVAKAVADRAAGTVLASYADLKKKRPEDYYNILAARDQEMGQGDVNQTLQKAGVPSFGSSQPAAAGGGIQLDHNALDAEMKRRGL